DQADEVADDRVTPVARRMADEAGISLAGLEGTGMGGRICREDVERAVAARKEKAVSDEKGREPDERGSGRTERQAGRSRDSAATDAPAQAAAAAVSSDPSEASRDHREEVIPMSRRRRTIASRLVEAQQTAAMLTTFNEIDMSAVMTIRRKNRESFEKRHGVRLGFMSFFVKAVIGALRQFPELNAEIREDSIVRKHYYDIGIAVGAEDGLVVPVLRDADRMTFAEIEGGIREYAARAGDGKLSLEDLRGGTFTITNGGVFGSMLSTPILNPPQVGILGLHRIDDRPIAVDGEIVIRPMMYAALTYDHRIVDGREAVQFLARIKSLIEVPAELLLDV
ncbi:MAG: dihydrolipoyllysine-residue succinyltransferase, partial [Gemmatimonadetes bacterium]|nr:dihydrolipoyllysine-residue succinyltransferase [Gemmatimonadota bacterium]